MTIDQATIINELKSLGEQRRLAQAQLDRIDGAEQLCRHLLDKSSRQAQDVEVELPCCNGRMELPESDS